MKPAAALVLVSALVFGQTFEVASIKPSSAETGSSSGISTKSGRMNARNVTLKRCMLGAYGIPEVQILGGPKWVGENRYDIDAKAIGPAGNSELMAMLQGLLAERFQLSFHRETRPLSGFVLTIGKSGLKAKTSAPDTQSKTNSGRGRLDAESCTMAQLALKLSEALKVPVLDQTEIKGAFDFRLEWTPDEMQAKTPDAPPSGPSLFSAVQEQLGLRLEGRKVPAEVLVIDRAELPSEN